MTKGFVNMSNTRY